MEIITFTNFMQNLRSLLDRVLKDNTPLLVTREDGEEVVVLSRSDFESMKETCYLLESPANAARLMEGLEEYRNGGGTERKLLEE